MSKRLQNRLRLQATGIEEVFRRHNVTARVEGGQVGADATRYRLQIDDEETAWEQLHALRQDLTDTLGVPQVTMRREFGEVQVEIVHQLLSPVTMIDMLPALTPLPPLVALLGRGAGQPLLLNLDAEETGHMLLVGDAGAGKSALLRTLVLSLALFSRQAQLQVVTIIPPAAGRDERSPLQALAYLPHLMTTPVVDMEDAGEVLAFLADEISYRRKLGVRYPHIVVALDDLDQFYAQADLATQRSLRQLLADGFAAGLHVLAASRPSPEQGALQDDGWPVRIVGRVTAGGHAEHVSGVAQLAGAGDFLVQVEGDAIRFQAAYVDDYDLHLCLEEMRRRRAPSLLAQPLQENESQPFVFAEGAIEFSP